jgi:hypothetical protein
MDGAVCPSGRSFVHCPPLWRRQGWASVAAAFGFVRMWRWLVVVVGYEPVFWPEHDKGVRWMPWRREAMKDVARCEKPRGDASDR